jgi:hypothetical protein
MMLIQATYKARTSLYLADTLSRAALPQAHEAKVTCFEIFRLDLEKTRTANPRISEVTFSELREASH